MWSASSRPRFLNTDNPTVNQGQAALGNQRRRSFTQGQRINRPGLHRQTEGAQLLLELRGTLE
jgi:hypothetical protein